MREWRTDGRAIEIDLPIQTLDLSTFPFEVVGFFLCCPIERKWYGGFSEKTAQNSLFELKLR
jgi:hypothetical protein